MMAAIFLVFAIALILMIYQKRRWGIVTLVLGLLLSLLMFWHHASDYLKINL